MHITTLLAIKYLFSVKQEKSVSTTIKICFFGILISTAALTITMSIINGFEKTMLEKMQSFYPQIILENHNNYLNIKKISNILKNEFPEINSFSPNNIQYAILQKSNEQDINNVIILKGIEPKTEQEIINIENKIITKEFKNLDENIKDNKILIGEKIAKNLNIHIQDTVNLLFPDQTEVNQIKFIKKRMQVSGIFKTGLDEFDNKLIFISLDFINKNFNQAATQIGIKLNPNFSENQVIEKLKQRFKMDVYSWKDLQPSLLSALKLEKYIICFIILLITFISCTNIISLMFIIMTQKQKDIAILKSMGMSNQKIQTIFVQIGLFISVFSMVIGLFVAYVICSFFEKYPFIELPDVYYVNTLPVHMEPQIFLIVFVLIFLISLTAILIPVHKFRTLNIANILKFE